MQQQTHARQRLAPLSPEARPAVAHVFSLQRARVQPELQQLQHVRVADRRAQLGQKQPPINRAEEILHIRLDRPPVTVRPRRDHALHGQLDRTTGPESVVAIQKLWLEQRLYHVKRRALRHAVAHRQDRQLALSAVCLRNRDITCRHRLIRFIQQTAR